MLVIQKITFIFTEITEIDTKISEIIIFLKIFKRWTFFRGENPRGQYRGSVGFTDWNPTMAYVTPNRGAPVPLSKFKPWTAPHIHRIWVLDTENIRVNLVKKVSAEESQFQIVS